MRKKILVFVFLSKKVAKRSAKPVWKITTIREKRMLFPKIFRKRSSFVKRFLKFFKPTNSGVVTPSQRWVEYKRFESAGYKYRNA